jgi:hypothetical protein
MGRILAAQVLREQLYSKVVVPGGDMSVSLPVGELCLGGTCSKRVYFARFTCRRISDVCDSHAEVSQPPFSSMGQYRRYHNASIGHGWNGGNGGGGSE